MEQVKNENFKLPSMIMCGDHSSFTKTELNAKEPKPEEADKIREKSSTSCAKLSPTPSRSERAGGGGPARSASEHALRLLRAGRRARSTDLVHSTGAAISNGALIQAAAGSGRWPPYLLAVCALVVLLTHALHALVAALDAALPALRNACQYFRKWTEEWWRRQDEPRLYPAGLALLTAALYALYLALYALHALALWAVEPLSADERQGCADTLTDRPSTSL
ncbi:uncharacterized protein LOC114247193 [Bombyx mandarina]|uniref:Uncharacterized protein LOC114247193 n=1 Tax=Bombyx mandarina TaxID=7092 RepID=A0A6J2K4H3_BOMMA|nr:uncharacterized protein LOC114247193 [Bombyx mandarina]